MSEDLIKREDAIETAYQLRHKPNDEEWAEWLKSFNAIPTVDRPQGEFTKREYEQFLHGISLSLLSKRSAQHWGYEEETAQKIRWLEALEQKVRAKMEGADDE